MASRAGLIALRDTDLTSDLARITIPTRVFHAINDQIVPYDHGQAVAAAIQNARLVTFTTAGHGVYIDERDKFNRELLNFAQSWTHSHTPYHHSEEESMPFVTTPDNAQIFYKDWGAGQPVVFSHGWPLTSDVWDNQLMMVADYGYRGIAHDRRGGGRSSQTWDGNHLDQYADDLATLIETLDLHDVILVGHSTGGGEVTRYLGRHGTSRVAKAVLLSAIPPLMLKTDANPEGAADRGLRRDPRRRGR